MQAMRRRLILAETTTAAMRGLDTILLPTAPDEAAGVYSRSCAARHPAARALKTVGGVLGCSPRDPRPHPARTGRHSGGSGLGDRVSGVAGSRARHRLEMAAGPPGEPVRRRDLIIGAAGALIARPVGVCGEQPGIPMVGVLSNGSLDTRRATFEAIHQGLAETGYFDGKNVLVDFRWAGDDYDRFPELVADLVQRPVAVIVAFGLNAA